MRIVSKRYSYSNKLSKKVAVTGNSSVGRLSSVSVKAERAALAARRSDLN
jgi:hypothetical protein